MRASMSMGVGLSLSVGVVGVGVGVSGGRVIGRADTERETCERAGGCVMRTHKNERDIEEKHRLVHIIYKGSKVVGSCPLPLGQGGLVRLPSLPLSPRPSPSLGSAPPLATLYCRRPSPMSQGRGAGPRRPAVQPAAVSCAPKMRERESKNTG